MEGKLLLLLLLLGASVLLASCQQQPQVSISPYLKQVYSGDFFYLTCENSSSTAVKWFFKNLEQPHQTEKTWRFAAARLEHSGHYHCEANSVLSNKVFIDVLGFIPRASLIIDTGQPVMRPGSSVTLQIENEDGLRGWRCWAYKGGQRYAIGFKRRSDTVRRQLTPNKVVERENIYWCTDMEQQQRSNQIIIRTSAKTVSLEMYPFPALAGNSVTLRCLVWGTDLISQAGFYVNNTFLKSRTPTYEIQHVTESERGSYKCDAVFAYTGNSEGEQERETSDYQVLEVYEIQMRAVLSATSDNKLSCSCPLCANIQKQVTYYWYKLDKSSDRWSLVLNESIRSTWPEKSDTYSCRAVWENGRSLRSRSYQDGQSSNPIPWIVISVVILLGLLFMLFGALRFRKRRQASERGAIYEDMPLQSQGKQYEPLQRVHGNQPEGEYETLQAVAAGKKKDEGGYEALRKEERKHEIYHTLQMEGAASGSKEYEPLRREDTKQDLYHTLKMGVAEGGTKDYEELRQEGKKQEVYNTLSMQGTGSQAN